MRPDPFLKRYMYALIHNLKVPLREVPRGVAQGHIVITTGRNNHFETNLLNTLAAVK